ncbi:MAG: beta-lactamase family protein [Bacteroidetes Order II. Incertae sedis bacterium]|nr:beta-lactamase family protein [Bacteroidetes Order II. bacterium]
MKYALSFLLLLLLFGVSKAQTTPGATAKNKAPSSGVEPATLNRQIPFNLTNPKMVGMDESRLQRTDSLILREIAANRLAGAVLFVAREGKTVRYQAYGMADVAAKIPMREDTIFRIASMSKAVTTAAIMILNEEGKLDLGDPLHKFIPAFKDMKVAYPNPDKTAPHKFITKPANRSITLLQLLTHTSGLGYGWGVGTEAWQAAGITGWFFADRNEKIGDVVEKMALLPLEAQPGESWVYGYSTDVLGRVVEIASGMSLDEFFEKKIFNPLGMKDSGFWLPSSKAGRFAPVYGLFDDGLRVVEDNANTQYLNGPKKCFSGGAGLISTAHDYGRFISMLLNNGSLDGVQVLAPKSVEMMRTNQVGDLYSTIGWGRKQGFGLGFWVNEQSGSGNRIGTAHAYGWGSAYYPIYTIDPKEKLVYVFLTQLMPSGNQRIADHLGTLIYQSVLTLY